MARLYINQIGENDKVDEIYRIGEKQLRPNKNGNLYLQFNLSDRTGVLNARLWTVTVEQAEQFNNGDYVRVEGTSQRFQGTIQLIVRRMVKVEESAVEVNDFARNGNVDIALKRARLRELLKTVTNSSLHNLADCFLIDDEFMDKFCSAPAGVKLHHAYNGGLLEHTTQMMETAVQIAILYPQLNRDLLLMGAFLHDIGKTAELSFNNDLYYTDAGQLLGHSMIGIEILSNKIAEAEKLSGEQFNPQIAMLLKHLLISHHGEYENQSAKLPMTLEAQTLHFIDSIDSKIAEFQRYITEDPNQGSAWTNYIPAIERKLYKEPIKQ
ncbi:MAG: HD domain-containing protein [Planctomycetaceae bacterium]|jgi:3'-5' exoribonuclease|nr:HD domain-containing protein [Planctomycetaceae bacterium]